MVVFVYSCSRPRGGVFVYWASARALLARERELAGVVRVLNRPITSTALPSVPLLALTLLIIITIISLSV